LEYASDDLKSDRELVMKAVKKDGDALRYAAEELKCDRVVAWLDVWGSWIRSLWC